jgi:hypothetical protein
MQRTGHTTSAQLVRYRRDADSIMELNLGWFTPLHEAIPELAAMPPSMPEKSETSGYRREERVVVKKPSRFDLN